MDKQRVIVYIDGFNFYYGLRKDARWKKYYWLDIIKLFEMFMRPNQELVAVKYFSARVDDIDKSMRQNAFFQANKENPKFKLILGKYLKKEITCYKCGNKIHTHLASMATSKAVQLKQYESRFKQSILPDTVHLAIPDLDHRRAHQKIVHFFTFM